MNTKQKCAAYKANHTPCQHQSGGVHYVTTPQNQTFLVCGVHFKAIQDGKKLRFQTDLVCKDHSMDVVIANSKDEQKLQVTMAEEKMASSESIVAKALRGELAQGKYESSNDELTRIIALRDRMKAKGKKVSGIEARIAQLRGDHQNMAKPQVQEHTQPQDRMVTTTCVTYPGGKRFAHKWTAMLSEVTTHRNTCPEHRG
jgi:hypothetical protein